MAGVLAWLREGGEAGKEDARTNGCRPSHEFQMDVFSMACVHVEGSVNLLTKSSALDSLRCCLLHAHQHLDVMPQGSA